MIRASLGHAAPPPSVQLRAYQQRLVDEVMAAIRRGVRRILVVLPTGGGKTVVFARILAGAVAKASASLVLAHRAELLEQTWAKLLGAGISENDLGMIWADDKRARPRALCQVASVQTLARRVPPPAKLVVVDEAHRAVGASYLRIAEAYPDAIHLGFTATPWRLDGVGLDAFYETVVVGATVPELIELGYLVTPRVYSHPAKPDLSGVRLKGGDYDEKALAKAVDTSVLVGNVVEHWLLRAAGARTIAFAASVEHSKHIAQTFVAAGVPAEHLDGESADADRRAALARLASGETRVVSNCQILTEGFDCPAVKCVILARPTKSRALYFQCVGRALRPVEDLPELRHALVLDHAGCAHEHGLPQDPQDYEAGMTGKKGRRSAERPVPVRTCELCFAVSPSAVEACVACGAPFPAREKAALEERAGELVEIKADAERAARLELVRVKKLRGRIQGWALGSDDARGWPPGETNRILAGRFGSRAKMDGAQLDELWKWVQGGEFARRYPLPVAIVRDESARIVEPDAPFAPPRWLEEAPGNDELVEIAL